MSSTATAPPLPVAIANRLRDGEPAKLVRLRDGSWVTLRPITAADEPALRAFLAGLSDESRRLRFFSGAVDTDMAAHWAALTSPGRYGLVAHDSTGAIVAHAAYIQLDAIRGEEPRAEVAVEVADRLHGRGLATIMIERLAAVAEARGIKRFVAEVLPENKPMLDVFRDGFDADLRFREGADTVEFPTHAWHLALHRFA